MTEQFYRVTFDDSAVKLKTKPTATELEANQLSSLMQLLSAHQEKGIQLVAIEKVAVAPDYDMDDSTKWMANLDITMIVKMDDAAAKHFNAYSLLPENFEVLTQFLNKVVANIGLQKLKYSGEWVVIDIEIASDFAEEPAAPKL